MENWTYSSSEARRRTLAESMAIQRRRRSSVSGSHPSDTGSVSSVLVVF